MDFVTSSLFSSCNSLKHGVSMLYNHIIYHQEKRATEKKNKYEVVMLRRQVALGQKVGVQKCG